MLGAQEVNLHKTKRRKDVGDKETKAEESEHDGGIPEEDAEYLPSLGSGEDGGATSSDDNSDAFVVTRSSAQKQNNFREKPMASRDRKNVNMKERTASEVEPGRECAKLEGHTNVTGKVNQGGHTHSLYGEQGQKTAYLQGERQNGHKIIVIEDNKLPGSGGNHITIHDVTPISSAPPIVHFVPQVAAQQAPSPANIVPDTVTSNKHKTSAWTARSPTPTVADKSTRGGEHGANYTPATTKSCPAPSNQKRKGTPTREQSTKAQATHGAMCMIREKLRLGPLAQQQAAQRAQAASPQMCSTPSIGNHHQQAETNGCPSFDLNRSFHKVEDTNRDLSTPLNPRNLDAYMAESEDDWGLDPEELQKVCFEAEAQFAKKKERERLETEERSGNKGQINDKDARTPTTETAAAAAAADVASSSRTPAAVGHERRVVRAPAQLRSPYIDPENADPFYCSKVVCDIYDAVCHFGNAAAPTTRRRTVQAGSSKPIINYDEFFISCTELANSMAPGRKMDSIVAEVAIIALREPGLRPKKRIMPLRITTFFQNNSFNRIEIDKHFDYKSRRLSRCESISFSTLEILDKANPKESGHYWLFMLSIRDKRFEVLRLVKDAERQDFSRYCKQNH